MTFNSLKRIKNLENRAGIHQAETCPCRGPWPTLDFRQTPDQALRRLVELDQKAELADPVACNRCGAATITHDYGRLTTSEQAEYRNLESCFIPAHSTEGNGR